VLLISSIAGACVCIGAGLGDVNLDNVISPIDVSGGLAGNQNFETFLYSRNSLFRASADVKRSGADGSSRRNACAVRAICALLDSRLTPTARSERSPS